MSNRPEGLRPSTRSASRARIGLSQGLDQPKTAADTSPKGSSLKQAATPTASEIMDQSKNQQSIQNDKDDIEQRKVSMEQLKSTMETQIVQINDRISQTESTTTERLDEIKLMLTSQIKSGSSTILPSFGNDNTLSGDHQQSKKVLSLLEAPTEVYEGTDDPTAFEVQPETLNVSKSKRSFKGNKDSDKTPNWQRSSRIRACTNFKDSRSKIRKGCDDYDSPGSSSSESENKRKGDNPSKSTNKSKKEDSDSDYSTDEDLEFVPTMHRTLSDIKVIKPELKTVLSYKTYRLNDNTQKLSMKLTKELSKIASRMSSYIPDDQKFSGLDPVAIIRFLEEFRAACNENGLYRIVKIAIPT
jgi:hypothetical protein